MYVAHSLQRAGILSCLDPVSQVHGSDAARHELLEIPCLQAADIWDLKLCSPCPDCKTLAFIPARTVEPKQLLKPVGAKSLPGAPAGGP